MKLTRTLAVLAVLVISLGLVTIVLASVQPPSPQQTIDCAFYENYWGVAPKNYAEICLGISPHSHQATTSALLIPSSPGFAHDIGRETDNAVTFPLNDFSAQTVLFTNTLLIFGYDFDPTATILYALDNGGDPPNTTVKRLGTLDLSTGNFNPIGESTPRRGHIWTGLTIHPILGTMYASSTNGSESTLYTLNPTTGAATIVGTSTEMPMLIDISMNRDGELYGHEIINERIYKIDPATGIPTLIGPTGYQANFAQGMDFDNDDGTLYIFLYLSEGSNLYGTVDLETGAVTPLSFDSPLGEFEGATQTTARDLILYKTVGLDPNVCASTKTIDILAGTEVYYCYEVINTGDITRTRHDLVDSELGTIEMDYLLPLAPGSTTRLTQTAIITETTINTATWTAYNAGPSEVVSSSAVAVVNVPPPSIALTITAGLDPNACSPYSLLPIPSGGADVTYCFEAHNTGLISFTMHDLVDNRLGLILDDELRALLPGTSTWVTATDFITAATGNTATWTAFNPGPADVADAEAQAEVVLATGLGCANPAEGFEYGIPLAGEWLTQTTTGSVFWDTTANDNACGNENGENNTPGSGFAACADSDRLNFYGAPYDAELWTNSFSLSSTAQASLQFAAAYKDRYSSLAGTDRFDIDVSTNNGASWHNELRWDETHPGEIVNLNLNAYVGEAEVRVRFRYYSDGGGWDWWAHIDDVELVCGDPTIELVKTVGTDPGNCGTMDVLTFNQTTTVHYCYEVTNHSGITLTTHDLIDSELGPLRSNFAWDLSPGASYWLTQSAIISETTVNLATWTAVSSGPLVFTGTDTVSATVIIDPTMEDPYQINLPMVLKQTVP